MRHLIKCSLMGLLGIYLSGCVFHSHGDDYLNSQAAKPMSVPAGLSSAKVNNYYSVPAGVSKNQSKSVDLTPPE